MHRMFMKCKIFKKYHEVGQVETQVHIISNLFSQWSSWNHNVSVGVKTAIRVRAISLLDYICYLSVSPWTLARHDPPLYGWKVSPDLLAPALVTDTYWAFNKYMLSKLMCELVDTSPRGICIHVGRHAWSQHSYCHCMNWKISGFAPLDQPKAGAGAGVC